MLGKKDLQEKLAQRESALKQREAEIAVLTKRVEELTANEGRLKTELEGYHSRREAIVNALTEAQRSSARIRQEAEAYKAEVVGTAYSERDAARQEARETIQKAEETAASIKAKAEEEAKDIHAQAEGRAKDRQAQADAYVADLEQKAAILKERLRQTGEEARSQAEAFGAFVTDIANTGFGTVEVPAAELPADYDSPKELMQSIYAIQGRELPQEEAEEQPQEAQKATAETDVDALLAELVSALDGPGEAAEPEEEQVYSVEEVLATAEKEPGQDGQPANAASDLDAIIDDILRGV